MLIYIVKKLPIYFTILIIYRELNLYANSQQDVMYQHTNVSYNRIFAGNKFEGLVVETVVCFRNFSIFQC